jgi:hypothetical protein
MGTLAVALDLNATAYSFFNAYVVKPAAVHDPGTLYQASWENRGGFFHRFSWTEAGERLKIRKANRMSPHSDSRRIRALDG